VSRNVPFAGAYISQHYGKPKRGQHVIQIEIDRSLYLDEASIKPLASFVDFQTRLRTVIEKVAAVELGKDQIAAE
jgi:N-formylglutamate deformylase